MESRLEHHSIPGHWSALQILFSSRAGHLSPLWFGCWMTSRVLVLIPLPQVALQSPHVDQSPTLQSTEDLYLVKIWWWKSKSLMGIGYLGTGEYCRPLFLPEPDTSLPHSLAAGWPPEFWSWFLYRKSHRNHPMLTNRQLCSQLKIHSRMCQKKTKVGQTTFLVWYVLGLWYPKTVPKNWTISIKFEWPQPLFSFLPFKRVKWLQNRSKNMIFKNWLDTRSKKIKSGCGHLILPWAKFSNILGQFLDIIDPKHLRYFWFIDTP